MNGKEYQDTMKKITTRLSKAKVSVRKEDEKEFNTFLANAKAHGIDVKKRLGRTS